MSCNQVEPMRFPDSLLCLFKHEYQLQLHSVYQMATFLIWLSCQTQGHTTASPKDQHNIWISTYNSYNLILLRPYFTAFGMIRIKLIKKQDRFVMVNVFTYIFGHVRVEGTAASDLRNDSRSVEPLAAATGTISRELNYFTWRFIGDYIGIKNYTRLRRKRAQRTI